MSQVKLSSMPNQHKTSYIDFNNFSGGLNLLKGELQLNDTETNESENMWLENGLLHSRPGRKVVSEQFTTLDGTPPTGYAVTETGFFNWMIVHIVDSLYAWQYQRNMDEQGKAKYITVYSSTTNPLSNDRGVFFRFGDYLYYKNNGAFIKITYNAEKDAEAKAAEENDETPDYSSIFTATRVEDDSFIPTILINANPETGAGDTYQPENRLNKQKKVLYTVRDSNYTFTRSVKRKATPEGGTYDGVYTFNLRLEILKENKNLVEIRNIERVTVNGETIDEGQYSYEYVSTLDAPDFTLTVPDETADIEVGETFDLVVYISYAQHLYYLPVNHVDSIDSVKVDGVELTPGTDYVGNIIRGFVSFKHESIPTITNPPTNNTVEITYSKENTDAYNAIMSCNSAVVYGDAVQMCIVMGGCVGQPNAIFWSGNNEFGLDSSYWPVEQYMYVGDTDDKVTAFGKQYDQLFVFKSRSIGKLGYSIESVNNRDTISLEYQRVNDKIGCDLPFTIQLIENNLVFANSHDGVHIVLSASAAYENNIQVISRKINGGNNKKALIADLRSANSDMIASSLDDGSHYWLHVNNHVWVWDYSISSYKDPCWWYWTDINSPALWFVQYYNCFYLDDIGLINLMDNSLSDFGNPIRKVYKIPARGFGSFDRLKDVSTLVLSAPPDIKANIHLTYITDWETRADKIPLITKGFGKDTFDPETGTLTLAENTRSLNHSPLASVFRRKPMCKHIRCFALRMDNCKVGEDLAVYGIQLQVKFLGRDR